MTGELEGRFLNGDAFIATEMPFIAVVMRHELRKLGGSLPKLYVVIYSLERDETTLRPVEWDVANALAPAPMHQLGQKLNAERDRLDRKQYPEPTQG